MSAANSDYLVENDLEDLYEVLEGGFLKDDKDFGWILDSLMDEGQTEVKGMFKC